MGLEAESVVGYGVKFSVDAKAETEAEAYSRADVDESVVVSGSTVGMAEDNTTG